MCVLAAEIVEGLRVPRPTEGAGGVRRAHAADEADVAREVFLRGAGADEGAWKAFHAMPFCWRRNFNAAADVAIPEIGSDEFSSASLSAVTSEK